MTVATAPEHKPDRLYSWQTGMPTKPDVDALMRYWDKPQVGDTMPYADITALTGAAWKSDRFKSITTAWRHRMQEQGVILECKAGEYFYVASAEQITAKTYDEIAGIGRKARRHRKKLAAVPVENDIQRGVIEHQGRLMQAIESDAKRKRMNVLPSTVTPAMPRISPPTTLGQSSPAPGSDATSEHLKTA